MSETNKGGRPSTLEKRVDKAFDEIDILKDRVSELEGKNKNNPEKPIEKEIKEPAKTKEDKSDTWFI